ncbi:MRG/MORF4L-binding protein [Orchesella cincta]|uniref:MRG/MORF4L-binding protein n=1 Tax=Orchesella cincta TaxID=48709 RepID=A0A1D2M542_ORCCI|nr:MRG/MORF4L-binding protein [Orchesella cincta]
MDMDTSEDTLTSLDWTDDEVIALNEAIINDGKVIVPGGINKHFNMIIIQKKFQDKTKKKVESKVLWDRVNAFFNVANLDKNLQCPFPNETCEFSLPDSDFNQLIRDRKSQSSQDKMLDDESRDSGSGRETPPTLPIAKRGASAQASMSSSNKRKYSATFSDVGSDSGSGRKSTTPATGGPPKAKRRI